MKTSLTSYQKKSASIKNTPKDFITFRLDNQLFALPAMDILNISTVSSIIKAPLFPSHIIGLVAIEEKLSTVLDLRQKLGLAPALPHENSLSLLINYNNELYNLLIDSACDVIKIFPSQLEDAPDNLPDKWQKIAKAIFPDKKGLVVILDIVNIING